MGIIGAIVVAVAVAASGCSGTVTGGTAPVPGDGRRGQSSPGTTESLFERLGGLEAIRAVVDEFVGTLAADARINAFFADVDIKALKTHLVAQLCTTTGGPCEYKGRGMKEAHAGLGVSEKHFAAAVEDLAKSLDRLNVPDKERAELLGALDEMKADIVDTASAGAGTGDH